MCSKRYALLFLRKVFCRGNLLLEGTAIVLLGLFQNNAELKAVGDQALRSLSAQGYTVPSIESPVRVSPLNSDSTGALTLHAGGWQPGLIQIRTDPLSAYPAATYLKHELMHEVIFRSCGANFPKWASEAAALFFSGELALNEDLTFDGSESDQFLAETILKKGVDSSVGRLALIELLKRYSWAETPCKIPDQLSDLLSSPNTNKLSWVLMDFVSGQILEKHGDVKTLRGPGSLLKLPYAASLVDVSNEEIGEFLRDSNTTAFENLESKLDRKALAIRLSPLSQSGDVDLSIKNLLGERALNGEYPLRGSLIQLAWLVRLSMIDDPEKFSGLETNGQTPHSTLFNASKQFKELINNASVIAKTGTLSSRKGDPEMGMLALVWPAKDPRFIAVFSKAGVRGAGLSEFVIDPLKRIFSEYPNEKRIIRVRLLSLLPKQAWSLKPFCGETIPVNDCATFNKTTDDIHRMFSTTGAFLVETNAKNATPNRMVRGVIENRRGHPTILVTDYLSYADSIVRSEGGGLPTSAKEALRLVAAWNGTRSVIPHPEDNSLCDTTHCMIFMGQEPRESYLLSPVKPISAALMSIMDSFNFKNPANRGWFHFASGSEGEWKKEIKSEVLSSKIKISKIISVERERTRDDSVLILIESAEGHQSFGCEKFSLNFDLPSCPDKITPLADRSGWVFVGMNSGFTDGLDLNRARKLALHGKNEIAILSDAYEK